MAAVPPNVPNLWESLNHFQAMLGNVHASLSNPAQKQALGELLGKLQEARADAEKVVPQLVSDMKAKNEGLKAWAEDFQVKIAEKQKELEARKQAAAQRPEAPAPAVSLPRLPTASPVELVRGPSLKEELLKEIGIVAKPPARDASEREIWDDWDFEK